MRRGSTSSGARVALCALALATVGCGGSDDGGAQDESASGFLRAATPEGNTVLAAEKSPTPEPPPAAGVAPGPEETGVTAAPRVPSSDASDLELASALLHRDLGAFAQLVDRRGGARGRARRELVLAFAAARGGQLEEARRLAQELDGSDELTNGERDLLQRALDPGAARARPAALAVASPLERAMELALLEGEAARLAADGEFAAASRAWSQLLLADVASPWEVEREALVRWSEALRVAQSSHRWNPRGDWNAIEVTVQPGDSLIAIRKRVLAAHPELLLCTGLIARSNGLPDEVSIQPDDVLRIPTDRASALVDVSARWAFYLLGDEVVGAWEVGVGKEDGATRAGTYTVGEKQKNPMWFQPGRDPIPFGDPQNPLGTRWLAWHQAGRSTSLGFHGTTEEGGVGGRVSRGCVRMRNADVELLFEILPRDAEIVVQP